MRARIREAFQHAGHELVLEEELHGRRHILIPLLAETSGPLPDELGYYPGWRMVPIEEASIAEPWATVGTPGAPLFLPHGGLEAVLEAATNTLAPAAGSNHLQDAVATRDRLLELVLASGFDRIKSGAAIAHATMGRNPR